MIQQIPIAVDYSQFCHLRLCLQHTTLCTWNSYVQFLHLAECEHCLLGAGLICTIPTYGSRVPRCIHLFIFKPYVRVLQLLATIDTFNFHTCNLYTVIACKRAFIIVHTEFHVCSLYLTECITACSCWSYVCCLDLWVPSHPVFNLYTSCNCIIFLIIALLHTYNSCTYISCNFYLYNNMPERSLTILAYISCNLFDYEYIENLALTNHAQK